MNIPYVFKRCTICGERKVASTYNFYRHKGGKYGLHSQCKECRRKRLKKWYKGNRNKKLEYDKQWQQANRNRKAENNKRYYEANPEYFKQYYQSPQGQAARFNANNKRRHKKEAQGTGVTPDQWLEMMQYFDFRCAYTGERLTDKTRSGDHVVPLDAGGDDMVWNMVPMLRNLNSSKNSKDMLEWYRGQSFYDPKRLAKIYEWQEYAYNKYGKDTDYFNTNDIQIKLL